MTSLLQKINDLNVRVDNVSTSGGTTDTTALQAQVDTNTTDISGIQTNKQNTLIAGDNITITGDTISSSGGDSVSNKMIYVTRNAYHTIPDIFSYDSEFTTIVRNNNAIFTFSNNDTITVLKAGLYKVEYNNAFRNRYYNDRANIRTVVSINDVIDFTIGGQNSCYARHRQFAAYASSSGSFIFSLNANDYIKLNNTVWKSTADDNLLFDNNNPDSSMFDEDHRISNNSNFNAIQLLEGSNMLVTYLD